MDDDDDDDIDNDHDDYDDDDDDDLIPVSFYHSCSYAHLQGGWPYHWACCRSEA